MGSTAGSATAVARRAVEALHDVAPGVGVGVCVAGEIAVEVAGVADVASDRAVTPETPFLIGSVGKVITATATLQCESAGLLSRSDAVIEHLPDLRLGGRPASPDLTVEHLLAHRGGMDVSPTTPSDADLAGAVAAMGDVDLVHRPGETASYSNGGWVLLGRLLEVATGTSFADVVGKHVLEPLGLLGSGLGGATLDDQLATSHVPAGAGWHPLEQELPTHMAPAGSTPFATPRQLVRFGLAHTDGSDVLSADLVRAMRTRKVRLPGKSTQGWLGDAWTVDDVGGQAVLGHAGGTLGSSSHLLVIPTHGVVIALLANGAFVHRHFGPVLEEVVRDVLGAGLPGLPEPLEHAPAPDDLAGLPGTYVRPEAHVVVGLEGDRLVAQATLAPATGAPPVRLDLVPTSDPLVHLVPGHPAGPTIAEFTTGDDGRAGFLHVMGRAARRTDETSST